MIAALTVFAVVYLLIASGRFPNALVAILGAVALVFLRVLPGETAFEQVNLEVIFLLAGMMAIAEVVRRTGAFDWAALKSAQLVRGNGFLVLCFMAVITAVASAFLDNVTVVVLAVPVTLALCKDLDLDPVPFFLAEVFASNVGGAATLIGDPPNIIVGSVGQIGFTPFLLNIAPASILSMVVLLGLIYVWFRKAVVVSAADRATVMLRDPRETIRDRALLIKSGIVSGITIAGFLASSKLGVSPAFIAVGGAATLVLIGGLNLHDVLHHVEWPTLVFFAGLFILVGGLVGTGVTGDIQKAIVALAGDSVRDLTFVMVWFSGIVSAIVDNVPYTVTMAEVVKELPHHPGIGGSPLWWGLVLGADMGGNATLIGASANVVVVTMARAAGYPISFMRFLKYGVSITATTLTVSTLYLWLRYFL